MGRKEEGEITWGIEILKGLSQGVETFIKFKSLFSFKLLQISF
jgi:hypothetical protein